MRVPNGITYVGRFLRAQSGATAIEYGLITALAVIVVVGAMASVGQNLQNNFYNKLMTIFN